MRDIFLAIPSRGSFVNGTTAALMKIDRELLYDARIRSTSLLTYSFNTLWAEALNARQAGCRKFVMLHDDVAPIDPEWLTILNDEFEACGADVLSAVVPMKDPRGLTSTAFLDPETLRHERLTIREACKLPRTFDARAAGRPGEIILPNTGLWICRMTDPWVEKICFTIRDRVYKNQADGQWKAECFSEDWDFGVQCWKLGLRVMATSAVVLTHEGGKSYPSMIEWGDCEKDRDINYWLPPERTYIS